MKGRFITSGISYNAPQKSLYSNNISGSTTDDIVGLESGGNYKATNPNSSAVGKYQFLWNTWGDKIKKQTGVKSKQEFLNSPELQDAFYKNYYVPKEAIPAINRIKQNTGTKIDDDKLMKLYHFRGEQGAKDYLKGKIADKPEAYNMSISRYTGIPKMRYGGVIPSMNFGGQIAAYSSLIQPISQLVEGDDPTNVNRAVLSGALQSGVVGAVAKGLQAQQAYKLQQTQEKKARFNSLPNSGASYAQLGMNPNIGYYAKGGVMKPDYEAEKGEVVIGNPQLEESKELAPGMHEVGGQSHENGGTLGKGGEFMFSNDIKVDGSGLALLSMLGINVKEISFSEAAKKVANLKNKYSFPSTRYRENNTNKLMSMKIDNVIMQLAQLQENIKQVQ